MHDNSPAGDEVIRSAANPLVKRIRRLATDRRARSREGVFVVEGAQPVWRAVESTLAVDRLVVCWELLRPAAAHDMVRTFQRHGGAVSVMAPELFERLSERDGPTGVLALVRAPQRSLGELPVPPDATFVVLEHVGNPGNLGTIVRTADAAGAAGVVLVGSGADPFDPAAVKASMGSIFAVPVARCDGLDDFLAWARDGGVQVVATSGAARQTHWSLPLRTPTALLFGAEGPGLSEAAIGAADETVRIPMTGTAESLNLSVAVAVMLYEARRRFLGVDAVQPGSTDRGGPHAGTAGPGAMGLGSSDSGAVAPAAVEPGAVEPGAIDPGAVAPGAVEPGTMG